MLKNLILVCFFVLAGIGFVQAQDDKVLIIHVTGLANNVETIHGYSTDTFNQSERADQHIEEFLNNQFGNSRVFQMVHIPSVQGPEFNDTDAKILDKIFPENDKILIEVAIRYNGDIYQWAKEGMYPESIVKSYENGADYVFEAIKHFKSLYPNSQVIAFSMYAGANVLIKAIEKNAKFNYVRMVAPPISNEQEFDRILLTHQYNDSMVDVIVAEGDEFAPTELHGGNNFKLMKLMKE